MSCGADFKLQFDYIVNAGNSRQKAVIQLFTYIFCRHIARNAYLYAHELPTHEYGNVYDMNHG